MQAPRRVIAEWSAQSGTKIAEQGTAPIAPAAFPYYEVWGSDDMKVGPSDQSAADALFPPVGGIRVGVVDFPAADAVPAQMSEADGQRATARWMEGNRFHEFDPETGMHRSETVDVIFMISGSIEALFDDGSSAVLNPGDALVMTGAVHAWRNLTNETARYGVVMVGAPGGAA